MLFHWLGEEGSKGMFYLLLWREWEGVWGWGYLIAQIWILSYLKALVNSYWVLQALSVLVLLLPCILQVTNCLISLVSYSTSCFVDYRVELILSFSERRFIRSCYKFAIFCCSYAFSPAHLPSFFVFSSLAQASSDWLSYKRLRYSSFCLYN